MAEKIIVSGMGILTSLGKGVEANHYNLSHSIHGLSSLDFVSTNHSHSFPFGEIKKDTRELLEEAEVSTNKGFSRTVALGITALKEAFIQARIPLNHALKIGLINATSVGGMCEVEKYYFDILETPELFSAYSDTIDCADCTHRIADHFHIKHFVTTISTACSSSANAIMLGARLVNQGVIDIAVCGGTDALTRFTINGFNALKNIDKHPCRPFDADRNGLNLGEGAAYIIIEKESTCLQRSAEPLAQISGYCNYNEAFHPTAPNPEGQGAYEVMHRALLKAHLTINDIDYINAHGTATLTNDESESNAMKRLFTKLPRFSSTKCYSGHTLAAAGAVEAVFSINALMKQCVYANLNFNMPMPDTLLIPQLQFEENINIRHVMSNSFAFGGNNASLIFSKL
jgi:3-oxoacyl-[acyl-carrier-protein] synthase-1